MKSLTDVEKGNIADGGIKIDVHCHLLNGDLVPDKFFKVMTPIGEKTLRRLTSSFTFRQIVRFVFRVKHVGDVVKLFKENIEYVAKALLKEMNETGVVVSTPLMMDLEKASFDDKPEIPYNHQIPLISEVALSCRGRLMPFVMVDPRREEAISWTKFALEDYGFLGVKMYPPLGYHPYHQDKFVNEQHENNKRINKTLEELYEYCQSKSIPITLHCGKGGAYTSELIRCKDIAMNLTNPRNWEKVLKEYPKLYLNFAHFGGDLHEQGPWSTKIKQLMENPEYKNVYADLSFNDKALKRETKKQYFKILENDLDSETISERIIFGTDWLMTRLRWTQQEYMEPFKANLSSQKLTLIGHTNPKNYLFPDGIPDRIKDFYANNGVTIDQRVMDLV